MTIILGALMGLMFPGFLVFLGFLMVFIKIKKETALKLLNYPKCIDFVAVGVAFAMHGGDTYAGGMAATSAGLFCAMATYMGRKVFGYISENKYQPGWVECDVKLEPEEEEYVHGQTH